MYFCCLRRKKLYIDTLGRISYMYHIGPKFGLFISSYGCFLYTLCYIVSILGYIWFNKCFILVSVNKFYICTKKLKSRVQRGAWKLV